MKKYGSAIYAGDQRINVHRVGSYAYATFDSGEDFCQVEVSCSPTDGDNKVYKKVRREVIRTLDFKKKALLEERFHQAMFSR